MNNFARFLCTVIVFVGAMGFSYLSHMDGLSWELVLFCKVAMFALSAFTFLLGLAWWRGFAN